MRTIKQAEMQEKHRNLKPGWHILATVATHAKTYEGMAKAINKCVIFSEPYTAEEVESGIISGFIEICSDGLALWEDGACF